MTKFIILSIARSGTNLLRDLLYQHPRIRCLEEVFRKDYPFVDLYDNVLPGLLPPREELVRQLTASPGPLLDRYVFRDVSGKYDVCGFKIFFTHPGIDLEPVWNHLVADRDIRVIHLWRRNQLRRHVSLQQALQTGVWIQYHPTVMPPRGAKVDVDQFLRTAETTEQMREAFHVRFGRHPAVQIDYEELADDNNGQMKRVFEFLGVDPLPVKPTTVQQNTADLRILIQNYDEVAAKLRGTRFEEFLEEKKGAGRRRCTAMPPAQPMRDNGGRPQSWLKRLAGVEPEPVERFHLFSHIAPDDADILPAFLAHYHGMGVTDFHFIFHGPPDRCRTLRRLCRAASVTVEEEYDATFDETVKCAKLTALIRRYAGQWVLLADVDEFMELPCNDLPHTIRALRACGATSMRAVLVQRIAADGRLTPLSAGCEPAELYPLCSLFLAEQMNPDMPPWKSKYPLFFADGDTTVRRGHHLPPDGLPSHLTPMCAVMHHYKWRAAFYESLECRLALANANANEMHAYARWLNTHDQRLPLDGAFPYTRATLIDRGLLRKPARVERRHSALLARLRWSRDAATDPARIAGTLTPRLRNVAARWAAMPADGRPGAINPLVAHLCGCRLRVALVTFQLAPPDRSAGIGTAFTAMAETLASAGHAVTILYVKPLDDHWQDFWSALGIELVGLPFDDKGNVFAGLTPALGFRVCEWLGQKGFDIVHFHDCLGFGAMAAAAKRQGLMFPSTELVVTTHGNTTWHNRGNGYPLTHHELRIADAEHRQLACADYVVSPSAYMFRWLNEHGYTMPPNQQVIPNILSGESRQPPSATDWGPKAIDEIVFFGRLEQRKGLDIFCDAIRRILIEGGSGFRVTFLGSPANAEASAYIKRQTAGWTIPWSTIEGFGIGDAIRYLRTRNALAVMPSRLDNYPYTILECLGNGIPFLASDVGGAAELVMEGDRARVLQPLDADAFATAIQRTLRQGQAPARFACDFADVELQWLAWHGAVAEQLRTQIRKSPAPSSAMVDVCFITTCQDRNIFGSFDSFIRQRGVNYSIVTAAHLLDDETTRTDPYWKTILALVERKKSNPQNDDQREVKHSVRAVVSVDIGPAQGMTEIANNLAKRGSAEFIVFADSSILADQRMVQVMLQAMQGRKADAVIASYDIAVGIPSLWTAPEAVLYRVHPTGGPAALAPYEDVMGGPCFMIRRDRFMALGGFRCDPSLSGFAHWDLLNRLMLAAGRIEAVPIPLYRHYATPLAYAAICPSPATQSALREPFTELVPPALRDLLVFPSQADWFADSDLGLASQAAARWEQEKNDSMQLAVNECDHLLSLRGAADLKTILPSHEVALSPLAEGIEVIASGYDPSLLLPPLTLGDETKALIVVLDIVCEHPVLVQLFWKTRQRPDFCEEQSDRFNSRPGLNQIRFTVPGGAIVNPLRLDPASMPGRYIIRRLDVWRRR